MQTIYRIICVTAGGILALATAAIFFPQGTP